MDEEKQPEPIYEDIGDEVEESLAPQVISYEQMKTFRQIGYARRVGRTGISHAPVYQIGPDWYEEFFDIKTSKTEYRLCTPDRRVQIIDGGGMILR